MSNFIKKNIYISINLVKKCLIVIEKQVIKANSKIGIKVIRIGDNQ